MADGRSPQKGTHATEVSQPEAYPMIQHPAKTPAEQKKAS